MKLGQGLRATADREEDDAVVVAVDGFVGHPCDSPADQVQGLCMPSLLLANDAQEMECPGVIRLCGENLQVARLRLGNLASLVKPQRSVKSGFGLSRQLAHHFFAALP